MEMHQVRYFLALCEELNFTRAAERCHVAQPSLTRAIRLLEDEMGGPLFHRERANTHLSELGRMVEPYLRQMYEQAIAARREALDFVKLRRTRLRLGIMCTIAPTNLIELLSAVQSRYPGIELEIVDAAAAALHERLLAGDLEVAIYCRPVEGPDERLHSLPLFRERFVIALPRGHRLSNLSEIRPEDLRGERYLNRANCEFNGWPGGIFTKPEVGCKMVYRSERDDWLLAMVSAGLGFGFLPEHSVAHAAVEARPLVEPEFWREVSLMTVRGRPHSPAVGALVREAMRVPWAGETALARRSLRSESKRDDAPAPLA
ncbi:MAG TPA: LysR family transcriptional regulator [Microvirga sp.]|jgi:DNA-binding transcriptional LysR family regulator|nr:LysR family transcriptional regulator [Microvirga sp.]